MTQIATRSWTEMRGTRRLAIPEGLWLRCPGCGQLIYRKQMEANLHVCPECSHHYRIGAAERVKQLSDPGSFEPMFTTLAPTDPLKFTDMKAYPARLVAEQAKTNALDAVKAGTTFIKGRAAMLCCLDLTFMMGSMGSVVGETVTRAIETATERNLPLIIVSCSGGARMQEAGLSLMQMAKTSAVVEKLKQNGIPYISVMTDPVYGGVSASLALLGDINAAEPGARAGFAGPNIIEQTIRQKLPKGFQRSEFLLEHGAIDLIIHRNDMRDRVASLLAKMTHRPAA